MEDLLLSVERLLNFREVFYYNKTHLTKKNIQDAADIRALIEAQMEEKTHTFTILGEIQNPRSFIKKFYNHESSIPELLLLKGWILLCSGRKSEDFISLLKERGFTYLLVDFDNLLIDLENSKGLNGNDLSFERFILSSMHNSLDELNLVYNVIRDESLKFKISSNHLSEIIEVQNSERFTKAQTLQMHFFQLHIAALKFYKVFCSISNIKNLSIREVEIQNSIVLEHIKRLERPKEISTERIKTYIKNNFNMEIK
ncbi:MAG: hypothetical protein R6U96_01615 [Promethearchaeia archaeon]